MTAEYEQWPHNDLTSEKADQYASLLMKGGPRLQLWLECSSDNLPDGLGDCDADSSL